MEKSYQDQLEKAQKTYDEAIVAKSKIPEAELKKTLEASKDSAKKEYVGGVKKFLEEKLPNDVRVFVLLDLAKPLTETQNWAEAEKVFSEVRTLAPEKSLHWVMGSLGYAQTLENQNRWQEALDVYKKLEPFEGLHKSIFKLGQARCLEKLDKVDEAKTIYETIEKDEKDPYNSQARGLRRLLARRGVKS